ncbi:MULTISPECIES: hypothetical protein [Nocardiopsis]|jgi:hypothetical protein|uniref:hypothetical protein n=1 Tax=Nocardiopsis TaxID=2013 RepID=UPI00037850AA|nr:MULTISPECIES: hypothetical protein [Nocardiopsis]ASU59008.1 hypothetical protein CGQ36_16185 [Nocardiopsis dassonvillei]
MSASHGRLSVDVDGIGRHNKLVYEAADFTDEVVADARDAITSFEKAPWGDEGEYSKRMQETLGEAEKILWQLLDYVAVAQRQAADGVVRTVHGLSAADDINADVPSSFDPRTHGGRR